MFFVILLIFLLLPEMDKGIFQIIIWAIIVLITASLFINKGAPTTLSVYICIFLSVGVLATSNNIKSKNMMSFVGWLIIDIGLIAGLLIPINESYLEVEFSYLTAFVIWVTSIAIGFLLLYSSKKKENKKIDNNNVIR